MTNRALELTQLTQSYFGIINKLKTKTKDEIPVEVYDEYENVANKLDHWWEDEFKKLYYGNEEVEVAYNTDLLQALTGDE